MKFNQLSKIPIGTIRIVKRFAFFPIEIYPIIVWLEIVYIKQSRSESYDSPDRWWNEEFVTKEEYLQYKTSK
jgi:hypothetical protein